MLNSTFFLGSQNCSYCSCFITEVFVPSTFDIKIGCKILFITLQIMQKYVGCGDHSNVVLRIFQYNERSITIKQKCTIYLK